VQSLFRLHREIDGDSMDDVDGMFTGLGMYVRYASSGNWVKATGSEPVQIASGDINGDSQDDVVGLFTAIDIYVRYASSGNWVAATASEPSWICSGRLR